MSIPVAKAVAASAPVANVFTGSGLSPTPGTVPSINSIPIDEQRAQDFLVKHDWPTGLRTTMVKNLEKIAYRFFVIDDSGSMIACDGNRVLKGSNGECKMVPCSRWDELVQAVKFHAEFAEVAKAPTEFILLNGGAPIVIGDKEDDGQSYQKLLKVLENGPSGTTPLCRTIEEIRVKVNSMNHNLRQNHQMASLTIATDGRASDGDLAKALNNLKNLPLWTVIRLCTDEDSIVNYYNDIDQVVELEMDVLDDLGGECEEVMTNNAWLNYAEPCHRLREFGIHRKEIDLLDEAVLSGDQLCGTLAIVLGPDNYPHPEIDLAALVDRINDKLSKEPLAYNPKLKKFKPWIDVKALVRTYGPKSSCVIM